MFCLSGRLAVAIVVDFFLPNYCYFKVIEVICELEQDAAEREEAGWSQEVKTTPLSVQPLY